MPSLPSTGCQYSRQLGRPRVQVSPTTAVFHSLTTIRDLLFAVFLSGDGNFHLQSLIHVKDLLQDPSLFGDAGIWVPYKVYQSYVKAANGFSGTSKVESLRYSLSRTQPVHRMKFVEHKLGPHLGTVRRIRCQSLVSLAFSASTDSGDLMVSQIFRKGKGKMVQTAIFYTY